MATKTHDDNTPEGTDTGCLRNLGHQPCNWFGGVRSTGGPPLVASLPFILGMSCFRRDTRLESCDFMVAIPKEPGLLTRCSSDNTRRTQGLTGNVCRVCSRGRCSIETHGTHWHCSHCTYNHRTCTYIYCSLSSFFAGMHADAK